MGMTPAVSLTAQSLEPVQAFAAAADLQIQVTGTGQVSGDASNGFSATFDNAAYTAAFTDSTAATGYTISMTGTGATGASATNRGSYNIVVANSDSSDTKTYSFTIKPALATLAEPSVDSTLLSGDKLTATDGDLSDSSLQSALEAALAVTQTVEVTAPADSAPVPGTIEYSFTVTEPNEQNEQTITCTAKLPNGSNYAFANESQTASKTVTYTADEETTETPDTITVGDNTYTVSLSQEVASYYYNATPQAPAVVFANTNEEDPNAPQAPEKGTYTVRYADASDNENVIGDTTIPTNAGTYNVTVTVNEGAPTEKKVLAGTYTIGVANINQPTQIAVAWNGQPIFDANGDQAVDTVSMNNISQYQTALTLTYPDGTPVDPSLYTVTQGSTESGEPTLVVTVVNKPGAPINIAADSFELICETAYFNIASAEIDPDYLEDNPQVYTGSQISIDPANIIVYTANGAELPQTTIYSGTSADGPFNMETNLEDFTGLTEVGGKPGVYKNTEGTTFYKKLTNWVATPAANKNAGQAKMIISGAGNYTGQTDAVFTIAPYDVADLDITLVNADGDDISVDANKYTYTSEELTPAAQVASPETDNVADVAGVSDKLVTLEKNQNKQFTITYANNVDATTDTVKATATITSNDPNFEGSQVVQFEIKKFPLSSLTGASTTAANLPFVKGSKDYNADVLSVISGLTVGTANTPVAMSESDYDVIQNTGADDATSKGAIGNLDKSFTSANSAPVAIYYAIVGKGNYEGSINGTYYVTNKSLEQYIESATAPVNIQYNGTAQEPNFSVVLNVPDTDKGTPTTTISKAELADYGLAVTYGNNTNASNQATITISAAGATDAATTGSAATAYYGAYPTYNWTIAPADLTGAAFGILYPEDADSFVYTGSQIKPAIADAKAADASVANGADPNVAKGTIKTAKGTVIELKNIKDMYDVTYGANVNAGAKAGTVTIMPKAGNTNMTGSATVKFDIEKATIVRANVQASTTGVLKEHANGATYAEPEVTVTYNNKTLVRDVDYTLTVVNNQKVGENGYWTVRGIGNYQGMATDSFTVVQDIASATITMPATDYVYDGTEKKPEPVVTVKSGNATTKLVLNTDYTLSYEDNINAGTATVIIKGKGSYGGQVEKTFTIAQAEGTLAVDAVAAATYTGSAITPEPNFTFTVGTTEYAKADLEAGVDYKYVYANNINSKAVSGKNATVTVQMIGNYGAKDGAVEFEIAQADVANATAIVGDVVVGGTPKVAVSMGDVALKEGTDYTFAADTKTPGTKTATITGKGNYTGTQKVTFVVLKENQVLPGDTDLTGGTWAKVDGKWQYTTKDDKLVSSGWAEINNKWYYFDSKGNAQTGWLELNGTWYYLNKAGEGTECAMVSNAWKKINGTWYHFAKSGAMQTGWQKINGAWYYLAKSGAMQTGWQKINGAWYYLNKAGQGTEGAMKTGWFNDNGTWYYLLKAGEGTEGKMVANQWKQINGSWFYFYAGGAMAANTWVGNYYVDANGYWVR